MTVPFHVPLLAVSCCPACAVPESVGSVLTDGATTVGAAAESVSTAAVVGVRVTLVVVDPSDRT